MAPRSSYVGFSASKLPMSMLPRMWKDDSSCCYSGIEQHYLELGPLDEAADVSEWDAILEAYAKDWNSDKASASKNVICDSVHCEGAVF
ncbi:hypothetical protein AXG93_4530s1040 [Marchantia polymorpha subsp. ruderalis]|uniref:Uncharacterized protein n=1 Tax=Marchantia polymorpha subsp. ruderalis TaxID=1480154 RepID=A0A176VVT3_MARPO|nr:hypothetical protein AXG93_4530s1040 [Marchantia polymorpha subsp. ruderalis]